ncbi:hypothetical protein QFZ63_001558 [Streptomyces sp. B3I7]|uniref:hypothetical protein n=1 Tax=Streptomyces sp. B3I7 TaxID=3042269 RepID=UPI00278A16D8|nr:hypothetical protein [Streptomyces sp. B3I7]MDQ0809844.1 hypothetical protein [Streptomyces sp. B3I7]
MTVRIGVQADSRDECAEALAQLVDAGYLPVMLPACLTDGRWMARAVPSPTTKAPTENGRGPVVAG